MATSLTNAVGIFGDPESALHAAAQLRDSGFDAPDVISPIPLEEAEEVLGEKKSAIKRFTLIGTVTGFLSGFVLAAGTAVLYAHPTGGRPIIAFPPFLIIAYELTILFGIVATVIGFLISARLPAIKERVYVPEAAVDKFAVAVACDRDEQLQRAETILRGAGAVEVRQQAEEQS